MKPISHSLLGTFVVLCLFILSGHAVADDFIPSYDPTLEVTRAHGPIKVDGNLDDPGWQGAAKADNFAEHQPGDQVKPPVETEALITYDQDHLYVAFVCYDDPSAVRASICDRERIHSDDNIVFLLDTYGDAVWAYEIMSNPYGVQADLLWTRSGGEDDTYDLVYESAARITKSGYQVELAIPFASLRFPNKAEQVWKVDFWRNHPRDVRGQYSWAAYDRDDPCWPCQWGTVTGIGDVNPGKGIEIMPSFLGYQAGGLNEREEFRNDDPDGEIALNGKYSITSNIVAEGTYNPDFSQIESDVAQIDVNTTFALNYPERRPFFQEGSDLFRSWMSLVYTRSINDPEVAGKLTARLDRTSVAYLAARDAHTPFIIPQEEGSAYLLGEKSTSNILRARREFGEENYLGLLVTDRRIDDGGSGTVMSLDGQLKISKHLRLQWQALASHSEEPDDEQLSSQVQDWVEWEVIDSTFADGDYTSAFDGESFWGHALTFNLEQRSRNWMTDVYFVQRAPTFRADNGFEPRNDWQLAEANVGYLYYPESKLFEWINPSASFGSRWTVAGAKKDEWVWLNLAGKLKIAQTEAHTQYMRSGENFGGLQFDDIWNVHHCAHFKPSEAIAFGGSIDYGHRIARRHLRMGMEYFVSAWLDIKPGDRMLVENWFYYNQSHDLYTSEELFEGFIYRTRLSYQFTNRLSLRWVVQYDDFGELWEIAPLVTYRLSPFSVFYIGSTYGYDSFDDPDDNRLDKVSRLNSRQFFMKLQYLFQM